MAIAPFFERSAIAAGRHLSVTPSSLAQVLDDSLVEVVLGPGCKSGNDRWIAELLVNMLARLYPRLRLRGSAAAVDELASLALAINPRIELTASGGTRSVRVAIGGGRAGGPLLTGNADGWVASTTWGEHSLRSPPAGENPYSSGATAALIAAEVFRAIFAEFLPYRLPSPQRQVSLLDFGESGSREPAGARELGSVAVVGLGAVGSAACWAWSRHEGLKGHLLLVEPEELELSNLQRYVLPVSTDVGRNKTDIVAGAFVESSVTTASYHEELSVFADRFSAGFEVPTVCISVDNVVGRRQAQALLPRLVVNGWTSASGLGASWHRFGRDGQACLACLYQPAGAGPSQTELVAQALGLDHTRAATLWITNSSPSPDDLKVIAKHLGVGPATLAAWRTQPLRHVYTDIICGSAAIDIGSQHGKEAVPLCHQSVMAGVLMAAELVKRTDPSLDVRSQTEVLTTWDDVLRPAPSRWPQPRGRNARCICSDAVYLSAYAAKWT